MSAPRVIAEAFERNGMLKSLAKRLRAADMRNELIRKQEEADKLLNPFQTIEDINPIEWVKMAVGVVVVPVRFIIVLIVLAIGTIFMCMSVAGADISKPLSSRRGKAQRIIIYTCSVLMMACFGVYAPRVIGERASSKECKMLVVGPHSTVMDAIVLAYACRGPSSVGKIETLKSIVGPFLKASQTIFVDREDKENRHQVADEIAARADMKGDWQRQIALFPEGTCHNRTSLLSFRAGAFNPGQPVQPVVLHWSYKNFDPSWTVGCKSRALVVFQTLSQVYHSVTVEFLPIYTPNEEEKKDAFLFARNVRDEMAKSMGVPTTDFSYQDMFLAKFASKNNIRPARTLPFSFETLKKKTSHLNLEGVDLFETTKSVLRCFAVAPEMTRDGQMTKTQFDAVAQTTKDTLGGGFENVAWSSIEKNDDEVTITFTAFLLAYLNAKYSM